MLTPDHGVERPGKGLRSLPVGPTAGSLPPGRAGIGLDEIGLFEVNESSAAQALAVIRELGQGIAAIFERV